VLFSADEPASADEEDNITERSFDDRLRKQGQPSDTKGHTYCGCDKNGEQGVPIQMFPDRSEGGQKHRGGQDDVKRAMFSQTYLTFGVLFPWPRMRGGLATLV